MMSQLETTIVKEASNYLGEINIFFKRLSTGVANDEDQDDYARAHASLTALLALAHIAESGMSEKAIQALLEIEATEARFASESITGRDQQAAKVTTS